MRWAWGCGVGLRCGEGGASVIEGVGFFEEVIVAAGVGGDLAGVDVEELGGDFADEVDVVGDEDEGSVIALEGELEGFDCMDVEVGCGLVHEEDIGWVDEELDEVEPGFFSAAEDLGFFVDIVPFEEEGAEDTAGFVFAHGGCAGEDFIEDGVLGVESCCAVLAEVANFGVMAEVTITLLAIDDAGEDFEEGGFTGAVGADEYDPFTAFDDEVEAGVDLVVAVGHMDIVEADGALSAARGVGDLEADGFAWGDGFFDEFHALDLFELTHGLGGLGGDGAEAVDKRLE
ncbi:MAG: hypothetical protein RI897_4069 [Verrucomicrobiota bacterium]